LKGIPIRLVDTAGLRATECRIEREGVERAEAYMARAGVILYVVDGSVPLGAEDRARIARHDRGHLVVLLNKRDLGAVVGCDAFGGIRVVECSLARRENIDGVREAIVEVLGVGDTVPPHAVIGERHRALLRHAAADVDEARVLLSVAGDADAVPAAAKLREAAEALGRITGRSYTADLLDLVFSRFCIGK
jgi:tRNA modification GTPase